MKITLILLFYISILLASNSIMAQEANKTGDTIAQTTKYGLRVGADISKPFRSLVDDDYSGFEIMGDYRITKKFYIAAELGNEKKKTFEPFVNAITTGSYIKIGADYNAYNNWFGLNNAIFTGLRYGFSTFKQERVAYRVYTTDPTFPQATNTESIEFTGLTGHWAELIVGVKTEVMTNLYFSINLQLKRKITEDKPENFDNLFIPGFNKTYDFSQFGAGYGYTISYLIPIFKK